MDCEASSFQENCMYWSDAIVISAQVSCSLDCNGRCPNHTDEECPDGTVCAVEVCRPLYKDSPNQLTPSPLVCRVHMFKQKGGGGTVLYILSECFSFILTFFLFFVCTSQESGYYEECVDCSEDSFQAECANWNDDMQQAAEVSCQHNEYTF